ncbi:MAG: hypothetical protein ACRDL8_21845, partial [Solirubrobacteraceae bacterium]
MTVVAARDVWSRAVAQLETGTLSRSGYEAAEEKLRAMKDALEMPERSRVELYLELLEQAWEDRRPSSGGRTRGSDLLVTAHRVLASGFVEGGDRDARRARARSALRELERLATGAGDDWERLTV